MSDPIVCLSGSGNYSVSNFDLSTCSNESGTPVFIGLRVKSDPLNRARIQSTEGTLTCNVYAPLDGFTECKLTVQDGFLDQLNFSTAENYQLTVSYPQNSINSFTYGDIVTNTLLSLYLMLFIIWSLWYAMKSK